MTPDLNRTRLLATAAGIFVMSIGPTLAQDGSVLSALQAEMTAAAKGWESTVMNAARSLFWILATIEIAIAAVWLALQAASLDSWFAELVRRIIFVGFFAFVLAEGPTFAKAVVDSLFQIGAGSGTASPADIFNAGLTVATKMSEKVQFGLFEDNALAISAAFAMVVTVIAFSLVAAIFVSVMVEMYLGLLAGMIMLGLGGSSFTKDFAVRYLVYAFSVGMKLMALVMISRIGSEVLIGLSNRPDVGDQFQTTLAVAGIAVVVFIIAMYVPGIIQGVVQGASVTGGMETIRHGGQAASFTAGAAMLAAGAARAGGAAAQSARSAGSSTGGAALRGIGTAIGSGARAAGSAAKEKAIGSPGAYAGSLLGLANAKLDGGQGGKPIPSERKGQS
ncbi:P-type conjugative transfer protein TrbL [Rhizobium sp. NFACC06-2]|uniref:P-type conjugative transfer protein TrbL n=1 Tax=Rhizobium sp. NFACC06-2 TaxID=1566264 RepID=UPI0008760EEA|nr:P-type conjugative transfer protein TrbL [Rhizobium sp. NFACC06-2]SCY89303.1 type IV secretion system protein TrbL [Rhizobium sp. NFACC06-2]